MKSSEFSIVKSELIMTPFWPFDGVQENLITFLISSSITIDFIWCVRNHFLNWVISVKRWLPQQPSTKKGTVVDIEEDSCLFSGLIPGLRTSKKSIGEIFCVFYVRALFLKSICQFSAMIRPGFGKIVQVTLSYLRGAKELWEKYED